MWDLHGAGLAYIAVRLRGNSSAAILIISALCTIVLLRVRSWKLHKRFINRLLQCIKQFNFALMITSFQLSTNQKSISDSDDIRELCNLKLKDITWLASIDRVFAKISWIPFVQFVTVSLNWDSTFPVFWTLHIIVPHYRTRIYATLIILCQYRCENKTICGERLKVWSGAFNNVSACAQSRSLRIKILKSTHSECRKLHWHLVSHKHAFVNDNTLKYTKVTTLAAWSEVKIFMFTSIGSTFRSVYSISEPPNWG